MIIDMSVALAGLLANPNDGLRIDYDPSKTYKKYVQGATFTPVSIKVDPKKTGTYEYQRFYVKWNTYSFATVDPNTIDPVTNAPKVVPTAPLINKYGLRAKKEDNKNGYCLTIMLQDAPPQFGEFFREVNRQLVLAAQEAKKRGLRIITNKLVMPLRTIYPENCVNAALANTPIPPSEQRLLPKLQFGTRKSRDMDVPRCRVNDFNGVNPLTGKIDGRAAATVRNPETNKLENVQIENVHRFIQGSEKIYSIKFDMSSFCCAANFSIPLNIEEVTLDFTNSGKRSDDDDDAIDHIRAAVPLPAGVIVPPSDEAGPSTSSPAAQAESTKVPVFEDSDSGANDDHDMDDSPNENTDLISGIRNL